MKAKETRAPIVPKWIYRKRLADRVCLCCGSPERQHARLLCNQCRMLFRHCPHGEHIVLIADMTRSGYCAACNSQKYRSPLRRKCAQCFRYTQSTREMLCRVCQKTHFFCAKHHAVAPLSDRVNTRIPYCRTCWNTYQREYRAKTKRCACGTIGSACARCGRIFCMDCFRRYSWQPHSVICWQCQYDDDREWLKNL